MPSYRALAMTADGRLTYCTCPPDKRGQGRCNHVSHQEEGESIQAFMDRVQEVRETKAYHMSLPEMVDLQEIKGRVDLADKECEGGYISLVEPVWSPANKQEFAELTGLKPSVIQSILSGDTYIGPDGQIVSQKRLDEIKNQGVDPDKKYKSAELLALQKANIEEAGLKTGCGALNDFAAEKGYTATTEIYVLPYYMRQDTEDTVNPINSLYNAVIVSQPKGPDRVQEYYERLLDNKNVAKIGLKPLTSHGGFAVQSLSDLVDGKSGIMRGYITGFSITYSGRAVISPNIHMKYGDVGIPGSMAAKILRPTVEKNLIARGCNPEKVDSWFKKFENHTAEPRDYERLDRIIQEEDAKVLVNRQPSLHMPSMVCFKARVTEVTGEVTTGSSNGAHDVIQLNPMNAAGFNADFDGDTQAVYAINDKEVANDAWDEMSPFTEFVSHNPKNTGESIVAPTKDCLFGLLSILGA